MNTVFDTLFLRHPRLNYTAPAVCEVLFSSSSEPTITLDPIGKYRGPSGPVLGGSAQDPYLNWDVIPGLLCYNVYRSVDGGLTYELLLECIPPTGVYLCDPGTYEIYELFDGSEQLVATSVVVDPVVLTLQPQLFSLGFKIVKDGSTLWANVTLPLVQICDFGCYEISGISPDGETPLSDPLCVECGPGDVVECLPSQVWSWEDCACVTCPEEACPEGQHWDVDTCVCVDDGGPPGPCEAFIDLWTPTAPSYYEGRAVVDVALYGAGMFDDGATNRTYTMNSRVESYFTAPSIQFSPQAVNPSGTIAGIDYGPDYNMVTRTVGGALSDFGDGLNFYYEIVGISNSGHVAFKSQDVWDAWEGVGVWNGSTLTLIEERLTSEGGCTTAPESWYSPEGNFLYCIRRYIEPPEYWDDVIIRTSGGSTVDTGLNAAFNHAYNGNAYASFNASGWLALATAEPDSSINKLYFTTNNSIGAAVYSPANGLRIGGPFGLCGLSPLGTVVGVASAANNGPGTPFKWTSLGGVVSLGLPGTATSASLVVITDDELILAQTDAGAFYYWNGAWGPLTDIIPVAGTDWSADASDYVIYKTTRDGHLVGGGVYNGASRWFLARCCIPD